MNVEIGIKTRADAVKSLIGLAGWYVVDNEVFYTEDAPSQPTVAELDAEVTRLQDEWNYYEYARLRKAEYDKLNQDEMRFDDTINGTTTWVNTILSIKALYPKPI